jgi:MFS family permease
VSDPLLSNRAFRHLLALQVTFGLSFSTFYLLPKYLTVALGADATRVGLVNGAFALGAALAAPFVGRATQRFGAVSCLAAASIAMAFGAFLFLAITSAGALAIVARLVQGAAAAFTFAIGTLIVAALMPAARLTSALGLFITAGLVTSAVGPAATEWLMARHGPAPAFVGAGLFALAGLVPCRWLSRSGAGSSGPGPSSAAVPAGAQPWRADRATLGLVTLSMVFGLASGVMFTFHQPLALERGIERVSDFLVAFTVTVTALRLTGGRLMDRAGSRRLARWSCLGYSVALAGMVALRPGQLAWFGVLFGLFHGTFLPSLMALTLEPGSGRRESRAAWMNAGMNVGGLGVAALGPVAVRTGYPAIFVAVGAIVAASALALGSPRPAP